MNQEKVLVLASVASMIDQFNMSNIDILLSLGYEVHVACNFEKGSTCTVERINQLKNKLDKLNVKYYQIDFTRSVFNIFKDIKAYKQVKKIMIENRYKFIHCHSPIGGVVGRLACKKTKTKCIYTAHGFHFFKGAPIQNWLIFYPIEKWLSKYTDILITINGEDYDRAKKKFKMKKIEYVPGVGIDIEKFQLKDFDRKEYRGKLGYSNGDFVILSVGELNKNKNHEVVLRAMAKLNNPNIKYLIAGQGELQDYLMELSKKLNIENQFQLLGFRKDIPELLNSCNLYILPSIREGLNVSLMEAMACGLPCIVSSIRGNTDLIDHNLGGKAFDAKNLNTLAHDISFCDNNKNSLEKYGKHNYNKIRNFSKEIVENKIRMIYRN